MLTESHKKQTGSTTLASTIKNVFFAIYEIYWWFFTIFVKQTGFMKVTKLSIYEDLLDSCQI